MLPAPKTISVLDTNILVYALEDTADPRCRIAKAHAATLLAPDSEEVVPVQTLAELNNAVRSKYQDVFMRRRCMDFIERVIGLHSIRKLHYDEHTLLSAMRLSQAHNLHFWDCLIAACMLEHGVKIIYTENVKDFSGIAGIEAINPFSSK